MQRFFILKFKFWTFFLTNRIFAQSAGTAEFTDCISADGLAPTQECPVHNTKQCDGEVPVMMEL